MASRAGGGVQAVRDLRAKLESGLSERVVAVPEIDEVVEAIQWLTACRRRDGSWGEQQEGTTALAMIAIAKWRSATGPTAEARTAAMGIGLGRSARWLAAQANANGSWQTPWYTGVALQALAVSGYDGPAIKCGLDYIAGLDPHDPHLWHDRVHHAAQILTALSLLQASPEERQPWIACILRHVDVQHGPYVCGQAVHALLRCSETPLARLEGVIFGLAESLNRPISKSTFIDMLPALEALAALPSDRAEATTLVPAKTMELFDRMEGRSWYRDPEMTAWALLALKEIASVHQVVIAAARFREAFARAESAVPGDQRRERRLAASLTLALAAIAAMLVLLILGIPSENESVVAIVLAVLAPLALAAGEALRRLLF